jgi:anti-sigma factor RsiW
LNCTGVIREISNYLDGDLQPAVRMELEQHLALCGDCKIIVDQTKMTVQIFCDSQPVELPKDVRARLREVLRKKQGPSSA